VDHTAAKGKIGTGFGAWAVVEAAVTFAASLAQKPLRLDTARPPKAGIVAVKCCNTVPSRINFAPGKLTAHFAGSAPIALSNAVSAASIPWISGATVTRIGFGVDIELTSCFVWDEISADGSDKATDGNAKGGAWGFRQILVTRENNDLAEELSNDGADGDRLRGLPTGWRLGRLGVLHRIPATGTSVMI
jgi:hypothetical protein